MLFLPTHFPFELEKKIQSDVGKKKAVPFGVTVTIGG
jgi:hypothetical protein